MAIFSRFAKVLESGGEQMRVRTALGLINQALDEVLAEHDSEYDPSTRWAVGWFEQYGMNEGPFGDAESLSKAKNTSFAGMKRDGILVGGGNKVRLLRPDELPDGWDPGTDSRITLWEVTQHLVRRLKQDGDLGAAELAQKVGSVGESAKDLAYRLYTICERNNWSQEAIGYNDLVVAWPEIVRQSGRQRPDQTAFKV